MRLRINRSISAVALPTTSCWQTFHWTRSSACADKKSAGREQRQCCGRGATIQQWGESGRVMARAQGMVGARMEMEMRERRKQ